MDLAYPKKSSARRKKPLRVRLFHARRKYWASFRNGARELSVFTLSPPTVIDSTAQAIASNTVDLPEPFSPTRNVTGALNSNALKDRTISKLNGNTSLSCELNSRTVMDLRWITAYDFFHFFIGRTKSYGYSASFSN